MEKQYSKTHPLFVLTYAHSRNLLSLRLLSNPYCLQGCFAAGNEFSCPRSPSLHRSRVQNVSCLISRTFRIFDFAGLVLLGSGTKRSKEQPHMGKPSNDRRRKFPPLSLLLAKPFALLSWREWNNRRGAKRRFRIDEQSSCRGLTKQKLRWVMVSRYRNKNLARFG